MANKDGIEALVKTFQKEWFQRYRAIVNSSSIPMVITGPDLKTIEEATQGALDLLGYTRDELIRTDANQLYVEPRTREGLLERLRTEPFVEEEVLLKTKKGERWIRLRLSIMTSGDQTLGTLGVFTDITRERELEEEVKNKILVDLESLYMFQEVKTKWLKGHADGVARYAARLARSVGYQQPERLERYARLHDIGKLRITETILESAETFEPNSNPVAVHAVEGDDFLKLHLGIRGHIYDPVLRAVVRWHHERWDGAGYPDGLAGENVPLEARIVSIADAYEAMIAGRIYRPARTKSQALEEIEKYAGSQFDPELAEQFIHMIK